MDYGKGNKLFILFAIYLFAYVSIFIGIQIAKIIVTKYKNQNVKYERRFK